MDIEKYFQKHISMVEKGNIMEIKKAADATIDVLKNKGTIYLCGNGGSAADCNHLDGEFSSYGYRSKSLVANPSTITAIANDKSFDCIFSEQLYSASKNDILYAFSTSGTSKNITEAIKTARKIGMKTVGFTSIKGKEMAGMVDYPIIALTENVQHAQEYHEICYHAIWLFIMETDGKKR